MLDRTIVNAIYLVPLRVRQFQQRHPGAEVIIADATKARRVKPDAAVQYEAGWATARRSILIMTSTSLVCGDWTIPLSEVTGAVLLHVPGGSVLKLSTTGGVHYQFGMQRNPAWEKQALLPLQVSKTVLKHSAASILLRLFVLAVLVYLAVQTVLRTGFGIGFLIYALLFIWSGFPLLSHFISSQEQ